MMPLHTVKRLKLTLKEIKEVNELKQFSVYV